MHSANNRFTKTKIRWNGTKKLFTITSWQIRSVLMCSLFAVHMSVVHIFPVWFRDTDWDKSMVVAAASAMLSLWQRDACTYVRDTRQQGSKNFECNLDPKRKTNHVTWRCLLYSTQCIYCNMSAWTFVCERNLPSTYVRANCNSTNMSLFSPEKNICGKACFCSLNVFG